MWRSFRNGIVVLACSGAFLFSLGTLAALNFPPLSGRVVDEAGLLSPEARTSITKALADHEQKTGNQVVVVTLRSLQDVPIEDYGNQLGRHWEIGQKGRNNGALVIVAPNEREVRIEVGYGLEGTLTDAINRDIIEARMIPQFGKGDYEQGIVAGTQAVLAILEGQEVALEKPASTPAQDDTGGSAITVGFFLLMFGQFLSAILRSRAASSITIAVLGFVVGAVLFSVAVGLIMALVLAFLNLSMTGRGGFPGPGIGGGFPRGGSRGGGFSGGGGSFGGGGASGRW